MDDTRSETTAARGAPDGGELARLHDAFRALRDSLAATIVGQASLVDRLLIAPDRIRTVSYGKEFPFDPGHNEQAWSKNRRGHFVITSK